MRTLLLAHHDDRLSLIGLARWLASFSDLAGIVVLHETRSRLWRRLRRELRRVGPVRLLDVLAFRLYYKLFLSHRDSLWEEQKLAELCRTYGPVAQTPVLHTPSPNTSEAEAFIRAQLPDLMLARCKTLLKESVFAIPTRGTFVMHPGICPEYRNAHGCFWACAKDDLDNVGMTLLRIDRGVDTGPVYGYYRCSYKETEDSHVVIQQKTVFDNLDPLREKLQDLFVERAAPFDTSHRRSAAWGQPWLTAYLAWKFRKFRARRRKHGARTALS
jgi:hypothetical protein